MSRLLISRYSMIQEKRNSRFAKKVESESDEVWRRAEVDMTTVSEVFLEVY